MIDKMEINLQTNHASFSRYNHPGGNPVTELKCWPNNSGEGLEKRQSTYLIGDWKNKLLNTLAPCQ